MSLSLILSYKFEKILGQRLEQGHVTRMVKSNAIKSGVGKDRAVEEIGEILNV